MGTVKIKTRQRACHPVGISRVEVADIFGQRTHLEAVTAAATESGGREEGNSFSGLGLSKSSHPDHFCIISPCLSGGGRVPLCGQKQP